MAKYILEYETIILTKKGRKNIRRTKNIVLPPSAKNIKILGPGMYKKHSGANVYGIKIKYIAKMGELSARRRKVIELSRPAKNVNLRK